ncbi:MAG: hypothetical protein V4735_03355 [Pseudomonadota bacterium]
MRSVSHNIVVAVPALVALVLVALAAAPLNSSFSLAPNVAWLMTLVVVGLYPPAWPRGFAFVIGLLQDVLFGTPLGSQAVLSVLLAQLVLAQAQRQQAQPFRMRWLEAAGVLVVWHVLLWALLYAVMPDAASLPALIRAGLVSALWYPLIYGMVRALGIRD